MTTEKQRFYIPDLPLLLIPPSGIDVDVSNPPREGFLPFPWGTGKEVLDSEKGSKL